MRIILILPGLFLAAWTSLLGQPACVENNCCCGDPIEIALPSGDFEDPPFANPIIVYFPAQNFGAWTVLAGSVDVLGPNYSNWASGNPNGATQFIDLHGNTPGTMATTLNGLIAGYSYTLVLWYAKNAGAPTADCQVEIANGAWLDESFTASNNGADGWLERCFEFTAQGTSAELRFTGSGGVTAGGVLLDDITLWGCPADTEDPEVQNIPATPLFLECSDPLPAPENLIVTDNCPGDIDIVFTEDTQLQPCYYDLLRTWEVTDGCGNTITLEQAITVRDTEAPVFLIPPADYVTTCGGDYLNEFYNWIQDNGGGTVMDNCDPNVQWDVDFANEPDGLCGETFVTFTVTDGCGNSNTIDVSFIIADITPPTIISPAEDITIYCAVNPLDSINNWLMILGGAMASDPCGPVLWSNDFNGDILPEVIPVTFTATDACNNSSSTTAFFFQITSSDTVFQTGSTCDPLLAGTDTTIISIEGCETITITTTVLFPSDTILLQQLVCNPQDAGYDTIQLTNQAGCDSLIITHSAYVPADTTWFAATTCDPSLAGTITQILQGITCDSIIITVTTLLPADTVTLNQSTCDSLSAGIDTLILNNQWGCDSIVYVHTLFTGQFVNTSTKILCGIGVPYTDTLVITGGNCDSLFITNYFYKIPDTTYTTMGTCDPAATGTIVTVMTDAFGCDSLLISTTVLLNSDTTHIIGKVCDKAQAIHDTTTLQNQFGCDSLVITDIAYIGIDTMYLQQFSCDSLDLGTEVIVTQGLYCDTVRVIETNWTAFSISRDTMYSCATSGPTQDTLTFTNSSGCDSLIIQTTIYTQLGAVAFAQDESCLGFSDGTIWLENISGGLEPYSFRMNNGPYQTQPVFSGLAPGVYLVEVVDARGCTRTFGGQTVEAGQVVVVDAGADQTVSAGSYINLNVTSNELIAQYQWLAIDPLDCVTCPQVRLGPIQVDQSVTVQVISDQGCTASDVLDIRVNQRGSVYIPNSFSPNGDGINDVFTIYGNASISFVRNLAIYDRWGNSLYYREDLNINDPSQGWDGLFRGRMMDPGVYIYAFEVVFADGSVRLYKGDVTLVR